MPRTSQDHWRNNPWRSNLKLLIEEKQFIYGTLLGDTSILLPNKRSLNPRLACNHGIIQEEWARHKAKILERLCPHLEIKANAGYGETMIRFVTACLPALRKIDTIVRPQGKKFVTKRWLDQLGPKGMAWWFCDDGSLLRRPFNAAFHTEGYTLEENKTIQKWLLKRYGACNLYLHKRGYYHIRLPKSATIRLFAEINRYIPPSMKYKTC